MACSLYTGFQGPQVYSAAGIRIWTDTNSRDMLNVLILERKPETNEFWTAFISLHKTNPLVVNITPIHVTRTTTDLLGPAGLDLADYIFTVGPHDANGLIVPTRVQGIFNLQRIFDESPRDTDQLDFLIYNQMLRYSAMSRIHLMQHCRCYTWAEIFRNLRAFPNILLRLSTTLPTLFQWRSVASMDVTYKDHRAEPVTPPPRDANAPPSYEEAVRVLPNPPQEIANVMDLGLPNLDAEDLFPELGELEIDEDILDLSPGRSPTLDGVDEVDAVPEAQPVQELAAAHNDNEIVNQNGPLEEIRQPYPTMYSPASPAFMHYLTPPTHSPPNLSVNAPLDLQRGFYQRYENDGQGASSWVRPRGRNNRRRNNRNAAQQRQGRRGRHEFNYRGNRHICAQRGNRGSSRPRYPNNRPNCY